METGFLIGTARPVQPSMWDRMQLNCWTRVVPCKMVMDPYGDSLVENEIIGLTARIVSAHISNNDVPAGQLPRLIHDVHGALATVGQAPAEAIKAVPAVDPKKSIFADHILCLDCGQSLKMLKRHIRTDHQMTPDAYRAKWGLTMSYPMVAPEYAATRSKLAKESGLGRKEEAPPPPKKVSKKSGLGQKVEAAPAPKNGGRPKPS
jgi:MucR family transcriptional regulator, transcriptional regulator of exopolysaccharide biosynthesis